jgi:hypothetical protein
MCESGGTGDKKVGQEAQGIEQWVSSGGTRGVRVGQEQTGGRRVVQWY